MMDTRVPHANEQIARKLAIRDSSICCLVVSNLIGHGREGERCWRLAVKERRMLREQTTAGQSEGQTTACRQSVRLITSIWTLLLARRGMVAYLPVAAAVVLLFC